MSYKNLTILITSFHSGNKIIPCLDSINPNVKVLIIENSSDKNFKDKIEQKYLNSECILAGENLGYAKGNNFGLSKIKTRYALILNPDAILDKMCIDNFLECAKKKPDFAIMAPMAQENDNINFKQIDINYDFKEVDYVKGYAMFLNLSKFKDVGFFDENFFIYFEEIDLCKRVKAYKKKILLNSSIRIFHEGGSSHDSEVNQEMELSRNWHWMWSSFYYHKKHNSYLIALIKLSPKFLTSIFKIIVYFLIFNKNKRQVYFHRFSGLFNSILGKRSWYRPKID